MHFVVQYNMSSVNFPLLALTLEALGLSSSAPVSSHTCKYELNQLSEREFGLLDYFEFRNVLVKFC